MKKKIRPKNSNRSKIRSYFCVLVVYFTLVAVNRSIEVGCEALLTATSDMRYTLC